ncbi:MAG: hypothetical protein QM755_14840 [Luteolibacter sp.]
MNRFWTMSLGWGCVVVAGAVTVRPALEARVATSGGTPVIDRGLSLVDVKKRVPTRTNRPPRDESAKVYAGGCVREPGKVAWKPGTTAWQAIQKAGGADEFGALNRVLITHEGVVSSHNLRAEEERNSVLVEKGDTIEVPERVCLGQ